MEQLHIDGPRGNIMRYKKQECIPQGDVALVKHVSENIDNGIAIAADGQLLGLFQKYFVMEHPNERNNAV